MTYQEFKRNYKEVTKQMQDYFEIKPEFRIMLNNIIESRFEELTNNLTTYEIFELQRLVCEIESINNKNNKNLNTKEINKLIDIKINKKEKNLNKKEVNNTYSKHKLYKLRSLKIKKQ